VGENKKGKKELEAAKEELASLKAG